MININYPHMTKCIDRRRQVELQKLDNEITFQEIPLPKYQKPKKEKWSKEWFIFFKQVLP